MNLIKFARESARTCPDITKRKHLQACADALHDAFGRFTISCSKEDMVDLVSSWTRTVWALDALPPLPEHGPNGGRQPVPKKDVA